MCIRRADYDDLEAMVEIYNQAIETGKCTADTETFSVQDRLPWFEEHQAREYPLYVYEIQGRVVGYVHLSSYRSGRKALSAIAEVSYYIHNEYHRRGIGSKLMEYVIKMSRELKYKTLIAILLDWNVPSIGLLEKFGFEKWGCLPDVADFDGEVCSHLYYGVKL